MITDSEGLVLRQVKLNDGRRIIVVFTKKFGKISAGTSINEGGKNKTALAIKPFTKGQYELFKTKNSYSINAAQTIQSFYSLGEDIDKYMAASYALELTDRIVPEEVPQPRMYGLICELLARLENRKKSFATPLIAFQLKALQISGCGPQLYSCCECGKKEGPFYFDVARGGIVCSDHKGDNSADSSLQFELSEDILNVLRFMDKNTLASLDKLGLPEQTEKKLRRLFKTYIAYHLGIDNLKSESLIV